MFPSTITRLPRFRDGSVAEWQQKGRRAAISLAILMVTGCAVSPNGDAPGGSAGNDARRELVTQRVKARWDALIKGDLQGSYAFLSPAARGAVPFEQYERNTRKEGFRDAKIDSLTCDADACRVKLSVTYDHKLMKGITTPIEETWVFDKGQAWYVYRG
jgi:hypothetical protein